MFSSPELKVRCRLREFLGTDSFKVEILLCCVRHSSIESQVLGIMGGLFGTIGHKNL